MEAENKVPKCLEMIHMNFMLKEVKIKLSQFKSLRVLVRKLIKNNQINKNMITTMPKQAASLNYLTSKSPTNH